MTTDGQEELAEAKLALIKQRAASRAKARQLELELNQDAEDAVDAAAQAAFAAGMSRSAISRALGESRVTVNERLARRGTGSEPKVRTKKAKEERVIDHAVNPYMFDGDFLVVNYDEYGPDKISGDAIFEIIQDEGEEESYWFLFNGGERNAVVDALDTFFDGWYYEDALKWVQKNLNGERAPRPTRHG